MPSGVAIGRRRWTPLNPAVDWSHPLAHGLVHCVVWRQGAFVDLVSRRQLVPQAGLAPGYSRQYGPAGDSSGATDGAYMQLSSTPPYPLSFTWAGDFNGSPTNSAGLFTVCNTIPTDTSEAAPFYMGLIVASTGNDIRTAAPSNVTYNSYVPTGALSSGASYVITGAVSNGFQAAYVNGLRMSNSNAVISANCSMSSPYLALACYLDTRNIYVATAIAMIHNRLLAPAEHAQLYADPFCIMRSA